MAKAKSIYYRHCMAYDYDALYGQTPNALGAPSQVFVDFFDTLTVKGLKVLDIGCGQGRDALFIARQGHCVTGVDISANGIKDLMAAARAEGLSIEGHVADITTYTPEGTFDIILIDRTLHMLDRAPRNAVLARLLDHIAPGGWLLLADETSNMADFKDTLTDHAVHWTYEKDHRGTLFARRP